MTSSIVTNTLTLWPAKRRDDRYMGMLQFRVSDPFAVSLTYFDHTDTAQDFVFARTLLVTAMDRQRWSGGDRVLVGPHQVDGYSVFVVSPDEEIGGDPYAMYCSTKVLREFLDATRDVVPLGREDDFVCWNQELAALLGYQVEVTLREADGWRSRTGTLAADVLNAGRVVFTFPDSFGTPVTWRIDREHLAEMVCAGRRARQARPRTIRLPVPGDVELVLPVEVMQRFLTTSFQTALDGAS